MRQAKEIIFQSFNESYLIEHFDMEDVEKICIGKACNLVVAAYMEENKISDQEQVVVVYLKGKPNRCFPLKDWEVSFLYENSNLFFKSGREA